MFYDDEGRLRSIPASWTDVDPPDLLAAASNGRAFLRADDLTALSSLVCEIKLRHEGGHQSVK